MTYRFASALSATLVTLLARSTFGQPVVAPARPVFAIGAAVGAASQPSIDGADGRSGRLHSALLAEVAPRGWPVELRGELSWVRWASFAGPVALSANAVVPLGRIALDRNPLGERLRPYVLGGMGLYGIGGVPPRGSHWNAGAGLRLEGPRHVLFLEARHLAAYRRRSLAGGIALGI